MNIDKLLQTQKLSDWCKQFGWQGGTIHQVKEEAIKRLSLNGISENRDTKQLEYLMINGHSIGVDFYAF